MTEDVTLVKQGMVAVFVYTTADLADQPSYLGLISASSLTGLTKSKGTLSPIYAKNRSQAGQIDIVDVQRDAPDLGDLTLEERMHKAAANHLEDMFEVDCAQTWFVKVDDCGRPDDPDTFNSGLLVDKIRVTDLDYGAMQSFDANEIVTLTSTLNHQGINRVVAILFAEFADTTALAEALDVIYSDVVSCGACAPFSSGCNQTFVLTRANTGSPGLSSQIVYSTDGHSTWAAVDIPPLGGVDGNRLEAVGKRIVVISEATVSHFYINKANIATTTSWVEVTSGYQAGGGPRAIFAKSPTEVFIGGADGYIYKSTDITSSVVVKHDASATAQNCNDIHAVGQFVLAGFDSNTILFSVNNGESYSILTTDAALNGPEAGANITAVWVINDNQWYVATNTGNLYYTGNQGATFTQRNLPDQTNVSVVNDIKFAPDANQIGAIAVEVGGVGRVYRTISGGRTWFDDDPGIDGMQSLDALRINAVALCGANQIAAVGLKSSGSPDGLISIAK
jgi:photosystem II stability/assembly factor-like uncharacterized protein